MSTSNVTAPYWARWKARQVDVQPWATVRLSAQYGHRPCSLLSIGCGWVSVRIQYDGQPRCEVYRPGDIDWSEARLLGSCAGVVVEFDGREHRCDVLEVGEARVWGWVARAVEVNASVEGAF